jgi:hypothetical protein
MKKFLLILTLLISCGGSEPSLEDLIYSCFKLSFWATNSQIQSSEVLMCNSLATSCMRKCKELDSSCSTLNEQALNYCTSLEEYKKSH